MMQKRDFCNFVSCNFASRGVFLFHLSMCCPRVSHISEADINFDGLA